MSKSPRTQAGTDISSKTFNVTIDRDGELERHHLPNTPAGHRQLIRLLTRDGASARVALEATGTYHLDLATALAQTPGIEVMVINPRQLRHYASATGRRAKTDPLDADLMLDYLRRMDFVRWQPTPQHRLDLQMLSRRIQQLVDLRTQESNRLHATSATEQHPSALRQSLEGHIAQLDAHIEQLRRLAETSIQQDAELARQHQHLLTIPGISDKTALPILAEVTTLPQGLSVRQWVACAGLDPKISKSGGSSKKPHISRKGNVYLRRALFMPAFVAIRWQPHFRDFYQRLLERGKPKRVAQVAAMRKMLHAIFGMIKNDSPFNPDLLFPKARLDALAA